MLRVSVLIIKDVGKVALEAEMRAVLNQFLQEIQKIEDFYLKMSSQYLQEFEDLKQRMQIKNRDDLLPTSNVKIQENSIAGNSLLQSSIDDPLLGTNNSKPGSIVLTSSQVSTLKGKGTKVEAQKITKVKDELEYATNWRRAVNLVFTHLKWLNSFAKINQIASKK